VAIDNVL
jgi:addiction module RelB/DinJ family antitoxin